MGHDISMSQSDLCSLNPITLTAPLFQSKQDQEITLRLHRDVPVLAQEDSERGWQVKPTLMFMMNASMKIHRSTDELESARYTLVGSRHTGGDESWLPLFEGKMVGMYDHRSASIRFDPSQRVRQNQPVTLDAEEHTDPSHLAQPMFWVERKGVYDRCGRVPRWCLVVKDITAATNERTVIASMLPCVALTDSLPCLSNPLSSALNACLLGNLNVFVLDFVARQKVAGLHLRGHYLAQLPILPPTHYTPDHLAYTAWDLQTFAQDVLDEVRAETWAGWFARDHLGSPAQIHTSPPPEWAAAPTPAPFVWDEQRRAALRAELDGLYAHLYGLTRDELAYILDTFPIVRRKDEARYGEYRTKRIVLDAYDELDPLKSQDTKDRATRSTCTFTSDGV